MKRIRAVALAAVALVALACQGAAVPGGAGATSSSDGASSGGGSNGNGNGNGSLGGASASCTPLAPIAPRVWRLSVEQYQSAVADLLGLTTVPALTNRGGEAQWAFFSDASLGVDDAFQYALFQMVEGLLPQLPATLTTCNDGEAPTACATRIARDLGARAFRRPLTQEEIDALVSNPARPASGSSPAVSAAPFAAAGDDTTAGLQTVIEAILLSPSSVYRTELGTPTKTGATTTLTPYEVASQLSFTFLGSIPDEALMAAAADPSAKGLGSLAGIAAQVDRLLKLPRVQQNLTRVVAGWFNVGQLFSKTHDPSLLSALAADQQDENAIEADLYTSAQQLITDVLWTKSGALTELLTTQEVFFNARLDALYSGVTYAGRAPRTSTAFSAGTWAPTQQRIGLLSHPGYFWAQSDPALTSIVKRGKAIHDDIVCADPLPPPVDLGSPAAQAVIAMGDSEATKSDARMKTAPCNGCHAQMDPYARLLQRFNPIGDLRTSDEVGRPIDDAVTFTGGAPLAPQTIAGPAAFAHAFVATGRFNGCAVQKLASYLLGTMITTYDTCELQAIRATLAPNAGFADLLRAVVLADFTRTRKVAP